MQRLFESEIERCFAVVNVADSYHDPGMGRCFGRRGVHQTVQGACVAAYRVTEPKAVVARPLTPPEPTTSISAFLAASTSTGAGSPTSSEVSIVSP